MSNFKTRHGTGLLCVLLIMITWVKNVNADSVVTFARSLRLYHVRLLKMERHVCSLCRWRSMSALESDRLWFKHPCEPGPWGVVALPGPPVDYQSGRVTMVCAKCLAKRDHPQMLEGVSSQPVVMTG